MATRSESGTADSRGCLPAAAALVEVVAVRMEVREDRRVAGAGTVDSHKGDCKVSSKYRRCSRRALTSSVRARARVTPGTAGLSDVLSIG
jgi:hypothetical protein